MKINYLNFLKVLYFIINILNMYFLIFFKKNYLSFIMIINNLFYLNYIFIRLIQILNLKILILKKKKKINLLKIKRYLRSFYYLSINLFIICLTLLFTSYFDLLNYNKIFYLFNNILNIFIGGLVIFLIFWDILISIFKIC